MESLLFFRVYPSDGFRFIFIPDGNPSPESCNVNSANESRFAACNISTIEIRG